MEPVDIDGILAANPSISREDLDRIRDMTKALRDLGMKRRGYRLTNRHDRKQVRRGYDDKSDPRTVRLSRV